MKQIIVNVSDLTIEEKRRVNEALAKITGAYKLPVVHPATAWFFAPLSSGPTMIAWGWESIIDGLTHTHTSQQVLEMAGVAKQGHIHADLMALYAENAKTTDKPWELWQVKTGSLDWSDCKFSLSWDPSLEYRRKPKTHIVNGVEVPDLRFVPNEDEEYWFPHPSFVHLCAAATCSTYKSHYHKVSNNLCYEYTEAGKQAAILHAKAWLGIA